MEKSVKSVAPLADDENRSSTKIRGWCFSFACLHCHGGVFDYLILCHEVVRSLHTYNSSVTSIRINTGDIDIIVKSPLVKSRRRLS